MAATESISEETRTRRSGIEVSISIRTILGIAGVVAVAWALASIANVLLVVFVSVFGIAVLEPVVGAMERRLGWSRRLCATALVAVIAVVVLGVLLVLLQAITHGVRDLGDHLPAIVDQARHSDLGHLLNGGSGSLDALRTHAGDITSGVGKVSGGVAHIGVSAAGAVTLAVSVVFLTLFG